MKSTAMPEAGTLNDPLAALRLLTLKQVREITGYSANHIYRRMREGTFPASIRIGPNSVRWLQSAVEEWLRQQTTQPPAKNPEQNPRRH